MRSRLDGLEKDELDYAEELRWREVVVRAMMLAGEVHRWNLRTICWHALWMMEADFESLLHHSAAERWKLAVSHVFGEDVGWGGAAVLGKKLDPCRMNE